MVKYIKGDVLNCGATLVAHQVNAFGVMGGIAAAIWPLLTPESQSAYVERCRHNAKLPVTEWMGSIQILDTKREELKICNLFTQFPAPVRPDFGYIPEVGKYAGEPIMSYQREWDVLVEAFEGSPIADKL